MPRAPRVADGNVIYHVLNRRVGREPLFLREGDWLAFLALLGESIEREAKQGRPRPEIFACCLMPNHWHLLVRPGADGQLSSWMGWLALTHTHRYRAAQRTTGEGPIYQGRFKSFPVQDPGEASGGERGFWTVARYVEANAVRAGLVTDAADWPWGSFALRRRRVAWLADWPVPAPTDWRRQVNRSMSEETAAAVQTSIKRGRPFGEDDWVRGAADRLGLASTLIRRGRPKKPVEKGP
ncbi:MAG: transposase [Planctomycetota bacterium]